MTRRKPAMVFLAAVLFFSVAAGCGAGKGAEQDTGQTGVRELKVTFFNVGKGDAVLLETEEQAMLIDAGYDDTSAVILDYLEAEEIDTLDYLVITLMTR